MYLFFSNFIIGEGDGEGSDEADGVDGGEDSPFSEYLFKEIREWWISFEYTVVGYSCISKYWCQEVFTVYFGMDLGGRVTYLVMTRQRYALLKYLKLYEIIILINYWSIVCVLFLRNSYFQPRVISFFGSFQLKLVIYRITKLFGIKDDINIKPKVLLNI